MRKSRFLAAAGITAAIVTGSAVAAPMAMAATPQTGANGGAGKLVQERNGLQCVSAWKDSIGGSICFGNKNVKWRGHVICFLLGEKVGSWNKGHGINASSCVLGVERAFVEWG